MTKDLNQIAKYLFEEASQPVSNAESEGRGDARSLVKVLRQGGCSKTNLLPEVSRYLSHFHPNHTEQEAEALLSHLFARLIIELDDQKGKNCTMSQIEIEATLIVFEMRNKGRSRNQLQKCLRFLSFFFWYDFTLDDAFALHSNLKFLLKNNPE